MSDKHFAFILASYAITAVVIGGMIAWTLIDYRRLRRALDKLPKRDEDNS
ncbi:MAG: heme exporter protein CcmD [Beijerinckiaceae bacterium]